MSIVPAGYKQTEVGVIPEDWEVKSVRQFGDPVRGGSPRPAGDPRFFNGSYIPWLTVAALTNVPASQLVVTETATCLTEEGSLHSRTLLPGTLIIANSGATLGVSKILGVKCCANDGIAALLNISKDVSAEYLAHFINTKTTYLREVVATGNGQPNLNTELIGRFNIPLPPTKAEQEAIAEALSDADALIESLEQLISKKRHIKQGAMRELLFPKDGWVEKKLGNTATLKARIGWQGLTTAEYLETGDYYLVTGTDFKGGYIDWDHCPYVEESRYKQDKNIQLRPHDVLVTKDGTIGKVALVKHLDKPATLNSGVFVIRPIENAFHPDFFYYLLCSNVFSAFLAQLSAGSTINHLYQKDFITFNYKTPGTLEEQTAIATVLSDMDAEIAALETTLVKTRQLKQGMMHNLLTGRIRLINPTITTMEHRASNSTERPAAPKLDKPHTWAFNEAVVISVLADQFAKPEFPLGRKRYTKLSYLMHRMAEQAADGYLKKAAGPYNPKTKYAGPERIALENGYIREHQNGKFRGFVAAEKIEQAKTYFTKWYGANIGAWLEQFRRRSNDDLERLATVDMAMQDLLRQGKVVDVASVRALIASEPEWLPKLERTVFSDAGIASAIAECRTVFGC